MASNLSITPIKTAAQLLSWVSQIPPDLSLSTVDMICKAELYRGTYSLSTNLPIRGITSTASQYVWIAAAPGHEHRGVKGAGPVLSFTSQGDASGHLVKITVPHTVMSDIEATWAGGTNARSQIRMLRSDDTAYPVWFVRCMVYDFQTKSLATTSVVGISNQGGFAYNCAVWNCGYPTNEADTTRALSIGNSSARTQGMYHCSAFSSAGGLFQGTSNQAAGGVEMKGCLADVGSVTSAVGFRTSDNSSTSRFSMIRNVSTDSSAATWGDPSPITQAVAGAQFANFATGLALASTSSAVGAANPITSDNTVALDITLFDRNTSPLPWDAGAYQTRPGQAKRESPRQPTLGRARR